MADNTTEASAVQSPADELSDEEIKHQKELQGRIDQVKDEIKDIRTELREKEALLAALEKEQGVTRFSKFKTGVVAGAGAAAGAVQTLGGKIRVASVAAGSRISSAFKSNKSEGDAKTEDLETSNTEKVDASSSFGAKFKSASDSFRASLKRATSRDRTSPTDAAVPSGGEPAQMAEIRASDIQKAE